ncbi:MAG TPA: type III secretion system outer membrane ring subunit SctC [Magnetospirillum sp.]|nr:type III secretion system outer membrane ring subunit SctC [Magnetospirillum sp.]
MPRFLRSAACLVVALAVLTMGGRFAPADAAAPPWPNSSYAYFAQGESLRTVIETFGRSFGIRTEISRAVTGPVSGRLFADTPNVFLDRLAATHGLTWFYHGGTLHVNSASETVSQAIPIKAADISAVRDALRGLGVLDERFGWGELPDRGVVIVSGPPAYVALVQQTLAMLPAGQGDLMAISVFKLKHASVDDRTFYYRDRQVTVSGVATILHNIVVGQAQTSGGQRIEAVNGVSVPVATERPKGNVPTAAGQPERPLHLSGGEKGNPGDVLAPQGSSDPAKGPVIQADTRLNAVIVKDVKERMPMYADLIKELDVPTALIEIEAAVIDVNTSKLKELGIRWQASDGRFKGGFGAIDSAKPRNGELTLGVADKVSFDTLLAGTADFFLTKVNALESVGDASVQSRPSVLTLDNLEAVLDLSETFYIKVQGERVADVVEVTAGVLLKVTPRLIEEPSGAWRVKLAIDVEDGSIDTSVVVSELPTVRRSTISTQAVIGNRDSLLIGGYYFQADVKNEEKVPLLGDIPLLGLLFSDNRKEKQKRERIFMITPRLVEVPNGQGVRRVDNPSRERPAIVQEAN